MIDLTEVLALAMEAHDVEVRGTYGEVKARCPLPGHDDRSPSFSANLTKGVWHCWACGRQGGVYDFLMEMEGITRDVARTRAAELAGGDLKAVPGGRGEERGSALLPGWARALQSGGGLLPAWVG